MNARQKSLFKCADNIPDSFKEVGDMFHKVSEEGE
jgi:hypothetical protein